MWHTEQKKWYTTRYPYEDAIAVPTYALEPAELTAEVLSLADPMSEMYGNDITVRAFARELEIVQMNEVEMNNKYPPPEVSVATFLEQMVDVIRGTWANESGSYVQEKLEMGWRALSQQLPVFLQERPNRDYVARIWGDWVKKMVKQAKNLRKRANLPQEGNPKATTEIDGWFDMMAILLDLIKICKLKRFKPENVARLADPAWRNAGEKILPGWYRRTVEHKQEDNAIGVRLTEYVDKKRGRKRMKTILDGAALKSSIRAEEEKIKAKELELAQAEGVQIKLEKKLQTKQRDDEHVAKVHRSIPQPHILIGGLLDEKWDTIEFQKPSEMPQRMLMDMNEVDDDETEQMLMNPGRGELKCVKYAPNFKDQTWDRIN